MTQKIKIHFILEGNEEETLFRIVNKIGVSNVFDVSYVNAGGAGHVGYYFQYAFSSNNYDKIYCVYDVDYSANKKDSPYNHIRKELKQVLAREVAVDSVSLCTNPTILLILLLGFDDVDKFTNISKKKEENTDLIRKYIPKIGNKKSYDASSLQLELFYNEYIYNEYKYDCLIENIIY